LKPNFNRLFDEYKPDVCAVEQLYSHYAHPRTAILMGHARGVIMLVARRSGAIVEQFAANRIKQSLTGHGHASKQQMQRAIQSMWNLKKPPEPRPPRQARSTLARVQRRNDTRESSDDHDR